jgi:hypothetical protein
VKVVNLNIATKLIELNIGQSFLTAFINADDSGLNEQDLEDIERAIENYGAHFHVRMPEGESHFSRCAISGKFDDCYTCEVEVSND